jgi:hypothetical protein
MLTLSPNYNLNYLAKVVRLGTVRKHSKADRLQCTTIDGNNVIVGLDNHEGQVGVFFPMECRISGFFLAENNLFREAKDNKNPLLTPGFFEPTGRVKALKLRGEQSAGFWVPLSYFSSFVPNLNDLEALVGTEFDTLNDQLLVQKYRIKKKHSGLTNANKVGKIAKPESILVANQFRFHIDTPMLGKNLWRFTPDSDISITQKLHGTSFISSKVLVKRKLSWMDKVARFFGAKVQELEYGNLWASRRVVKNVRLTASSFYSEDIWGLANQLVAPYLTEGMTVYGEVVGYLPNGSCIQQDYDYGCNVSLDLKEPSESRVFIYRITSTLPSGMVIEWSWKQIQAWYEWMAVSYGCKFKLVPEFYNGTAGNFLKQCGVSFDHRDFHDKLAKALEQNFLEYSASDAPLGMRKNAIVCSNNVPDEGVVVRNQSWWTFDVYKLKSFKFYKHETDALDKGADDLESMQDDELEIEQNAVDSLLHDMEEDNELAAVA